MSLVVVALAACGSMGGLYNAIPGDNRPHAKVDRARAMPIQGIDVARYQENVDFDRARAGGTHFVFMKATEGKDYIDPNFRANWARARDAGMPRGAYHFMTWCSLASEQAAWFTQNVPYDPSALPPVLDLEWNNHSSCKTKPNKADALEKIRLMLDAMERHTGKLPIIYTDMNFHNDVLAGEYFPNAFWLRSTAAEPHERYGNRPWTFWQYTQTGIVPGVRGEVDRNVFYGTTEDWLMFLYTGCDPRAIAALQASGRCLPAK
ncbi:glycoside hydrolase family 25 protein [Devosia sp. XJ19-1]|uniref:Lysozyme n=1 Tax=Devosia ureilytica TaxID=2952754 RepID=A0A9Q4AN31_9HYPH|nr:glycoside hydrolase family 25 protein [Devosia ureilytica]MCP8886680.1 glycoside hydrolase family 25 protein [Devosia ureilytica]